MIYAASVTLIQGFSERLDPARCRAAHLDPGRSDAPGIIGVTSATLDRSANRCARGDLGLGCARDVHRGDLLCRRLATARGSIVIALLWSVLWCGPPILLLQRPESLILGGVPYAVPAAWLWWSAGALAMLWILGPIEGGDL